MVQVGLPTMRFHSDQTAFHVHLHLDVFVDRQPIVVPAEVGISRITKEMTAVHTHTVSGIIHIENPTRVDVTLGQFFKLWKVPLTGATAYVNGEPAGSPEAVPLVGGQEIVVSYGVPPATIPRTFSAWNQH
jgi:hypothetical protein